MGLFGSNINRDGSKMLLISVIFVPVQVTPERDNQYFINFELM